VKNKGSEEGADAVGKEIEPIARAAWHKVFLHDFGEATVEDADDGGYQQGFLLVSFPVGNELFTIAPKTEEGEDGIH